MAGKDQALWPPICPLRSRMVAPSKKLVPFTKVHPSAPANSLTGEEWERFSAELPKCLCYFIEKNRIGLEDYLKTKGQDYRKTPFLSVYGHHGEPCPNCGATLIRTVIGGRSSVYCPKCQERI